jgi:hypothetical protein
MEPTFFKQNHFESGATVEDKSASSVAGQKKRKTREGADFMSDSNASQPMKVPSARKTQIWRRRRINNRQSCLACYKGCAREADYIS